MRLADLPSLNQGDQVYWEDPDNGTCSRYLTIETIYYSGNEVTITEPDGSVLVCFARELK